MTSDGVAEILVGLIVDPQFGQVLVLGAGGVFTELLAGQRHAPAALDSRVGRTRRCAASRSQAARGHRGKPAGDVEALVDTVLGVTRYAAANLATLVEIDVNPIIVRPPAWVRSRSM